MSIINKKNTDEINMLLQSRIEDLLAILGFDLNDYIVTESEIRGVALCHSGADNPTAFIYYIDRGIWKCWTHQCHREYGSDLIGLVRAIKNLSFVDAIKFIEEFLGNNIEAQIDYIKRTNKIFQKYKNYWQEHLEQDIYDESILERLQSATKYAIQRKLNPQLFQKLSIGFAKRGQLKNRIVVPVRNWNNKIVGFTGRKLYDNHVGPKWKHCCFQTHINCWNIHQAAPFVHDTSTAILCEGPFDVIKLNMAGFHNAVAIFGVEIHEGQIELLLKCHAMRIILALDNDKAALNGIVKGRRKLERKLFDVSIVTPPMPGIDFGEMELDDIQQVMEAV